MDVCSVESVAVLCCCCNDSNIGQDLLLLIKLIISLELSNGAPTPTPRASPTLKTALLQLFCTHNIAIGQWKWIIKIFITLYNNQ